MTKMLTMDELYIGDESMLEDCFTIPQLEDMLKIARDNSIVYHSNDTSNGWAKEKKIREAIDMYRNNLIIAIAKRKRWGES